ncbi:response regulator [Paracrocinitomix mangrovi]|uniref:response regulator n=1 Tax=Paracrocinitomix mangrovi TaxID=2862509 RepID=UPI001C8EBEF0|nr:response regulator [Paracrocinitomix mangrovi]UKN01306.1 response regulator [Paracrocinitomix mangrovi]
MRIGIVENEFVTQLHLENLILNLGFEVVGCARNYNEGLIIHDENLPDLMLVDIYLESEKTGVDLVKEIGDTNTAFIFISGNLDERTMELVSEVSFHAFLSKPFINSEFDSLLSEFEKSYLKV